MRVQTEAGEYAVFMDGRENVTNVTLTPSESIQVSREPMTAREAEWMTRRQWRVEGATPEKITVVYKRSGEMEIWRVTGQVRRSDGSRHRFRMEYQHRTGFLLVRYVAAIGSGRP
ncbi:MAG: hypothetical protein SFU56_01515 [Capsulimonadales bacterium]|nr:hypothetical protein [Capsulimonadales bacterium]